MPGHNVSKIKETAISAEVQHKKIASETSSAKDNYTNLFSPGTIEYSRQRNLLSSSIQYLRKENLLFNNSVIPHMRSLLKQIGYLLPSQILDGALGNPDKQNIPAKHKHTFSIFLVL